MDEMYRQLAAAVIWQAAYDYKESEKKIANAKLPITVTFAEAEMYRLEEFFNSERFRLFSEMDGRFLLEKIKNIKGNPFRKNANISFFKK